MNTLTRTQIEETKTGVLTDISGSKNLLVTFGGIQQGIGIPVFEFFNSVVAISCDKVFIRDFNQAWYQKGVDDTINSLDKTKAYLEQLISENNYDNICFMGNSMGGYAAILFGVLLQVDKVISFAPQTFIGKWNRFKHRDFRWRPQMASIYKYTGKREEFFNLKDFIATQNSSTTSVELYYSPNHRLDKTHAEMLKNISNINLIPVAEGGHSVVKTVRDQGRLQEVITSVFA